MCERAHAHLIANIVSRPGRNLFDKRNEKQTCGPLIVVELYSAIYKWRELFGIFSTDAISCQILDLVLFHFSLILPLGELFIELLGEFLFKCEWLT